MEKLNLKKFEKAVIGKDAMNKIQGGWAVGDTTAAGMYADRITAILPNGDATWERIPGTYGIC